MAPALVRQRGGAARAGAHRVATEPLGLGAPPFGPLERRCGGPGCPAARQVQRSSRPAGPAAKAQLGTAGYWPGRVEGVGCVDAFGVWPGVGVVEGAVDAVVDVGVGVGPVVGVPPTMGACSLG